MSLSSLQAQLASIQDGAKYSSSKRHEEAVGRGSQFSVQTGSRRNPSHRFQPSLLYSTAAEAADVPLSTLKTQFDDALPILGDAEPALYELVEVLRSNPDSNSLSTKKAIRTTLYLIGSLLSSVSDDMSDFQQPARHILEFLLRKYQIHVDFAIDLFWSCWLSTDSQLLQRCWELIDWAQLDQSYASCLRMGCGKLAIRRLVVRYPVDVIRKIVEWTRLVAITAADPARVLAQSTALILPALEENAVHCSDEQQEALLRTILPVFQFESVSEDYVNWSYCIASALVEAMDVSQAVIDDLCVRMLTHDVPNKMTAVTCVLSLLLVPCQVGDNDKSGLLLAAGNDHWIGCPSLSEVIYKQLFQDEEWLEILGQLSDSLVFSSILVSAIQYSVQQEETATTERLVGMLESQTNNSDVYNALYELLKDNSEESVLDLIRPHWGAQVRLHNPALLLDSEDSAMLYLRQEDMDWKFLASHVGNLSPADPGVFAAIEERASRLDDEQVSVDVVHVVSHFSPSQSSATACLLRWTGCKGKVREAAVKALADQNCDVHKVIATAQTHMDCAEAALKILTSSKEWERNEDGLVAPVSELFLKVVASDAKVAQDVLTTVAKVLLEHLDTSKRVKWIARVANEVKSHKLWNALSHGMLNAMGALDLVSACQQPTVSSFAVARLLGLIKQVEEEQIPNLLIPTLSFLATKHKGCRVAAANIIAKMPKSSLVLPLLGQAVASNVCSAQLGGSSYLSTILATTCKDKASKHKLLAMCVQQGGQAAATVLEAAEMAGESEFPLSLRWEKAGEPILRTFCKDVKPEDECLMMPVSRLLKGAVVADPYKIEVVSSGRDGGRVRSYSVGSSGVQMIKTYPSSMAQSLVDVLNAPESKFTPVVLREVLMSNSWKIAFQGFPAKQRSTLCRALVSYACRESDQAAEEAVMGLPLTSKDVLGLLKVDGELAFTSVVVDFIRDNGQSLVRVPEDSSLFSALFQALESLSVQDSHNTDTEFVVQSLLVGIKKLLENGSESAMKFKKSEVEKWLTCLLNIVKAELIPQTTKYISISTISALCPRAPQLVVPVLINASVASVDQMCTAGSDQFALQVFSKIIGQYMKHASEASFSPTHLAVHWVHTVRSVREEKSQEALLLAVIRHLVNVHEPDFQDIVLSLIGTYLALTVQDTPKTEIPMRAIVFAVELIAALPRQFQMETLVTLVEIVQGINSIFRDGSSVNIDSHKRTKVSSLHLARIAVGGLSPFALQRRNKVPDGHLRGDESLLSLCRVLMRCFGDALLLESTQWCIEHGKGKLTELSLRLWRDVLLLQSVAGSLSAGSDPMHLTISSLITECKDQLQRLLPAHLFLASTSTLIREGETKDVKSKALRLIAEKASDLHFGSEELRFFVEVVPIVLESARNCPPAKKWKRDDCVLLQSVFVALEHIVRATQAGNGNNDLIAVISQHLTESLQLCHSTIMDCAADANENELLSGVLSCAALCSGTVIRSMGPLCLSELPKLMDSLVAALERVDALCVTDESKDVVRVSIFRPLTAVTETLPQFLAPFLPKLLQNDAVLSSSLRTGAGAIVSEATGAFDEALTNSVAPRLLIPATAQVMSSVHSMERLVVLSKILTSSVDLATPSCVVNNRACIIESVFRTFDHSTEDTAEQPVLLEAGCALIDSTIMKLSEVQLRKFYASLREWRGEFDASNPDATAQRRFAFWTVTSRLCERLRTIFLPCLVMSDITGELILAANHLCGDGPQKPTKRRKTMQRYGSASFRVLFPLLHSVENAMRADAHQGGSWIRQAEENYEQIMEPLAKLLQCRIPAELKIHEDKTYGHLAHEGGNGCVVSTLVALASAVGDEHLWKPLNHAVLQACGDDRAEVRLAGLLCMMELMKALGEEYMTLLPENLPVLSDLLDDSNEELSTLTKEIITLSEELTGENLEDNLR